ncbi:lipoprotein [Candidatus Erwinia haradaeae]|uniref:lipoprotein n=1 Tax=Candidatus Erwinia haradaeae TaxID=1922217 RepID=UPI001300A28D|nr:lipoprotein [Candidatus Erwinia haradaeae]
MAIKIIKILVFFIMITSLTGCGLKGSPDISRKLIKNYFHNSINYFNLCKTISDSVILTTLIKKDLVLTE